MGRLLEHRGVRCFLSVGGVGGRRIDGVSQLAKGLSRGSNPTITSFLIVC